MPYIEKKSLRSLFKSLKLAAPAAFHSQTQSCEFENTQVASKYQIHAAQCSNSDL
ncbi:hypothetical protein [Phormidesmis sp. 146-33]